MGKKVIEITEKGVLGVYKGIEKQKDVCDEYKKFAKNLL